MPQVVVAVRTHADVYGVTRAVRAAARAAGVVDPGRLEGLALAATELATNLARYAERGRVTVTAIDREGRHGVEVRGDDEGPGIADLDRALRDGESTAEGSLGGGFGTMRRGVDEFAIESTGAGTHVVLRTWAVRR
ncbi:MAG: ATP-binding protein [Dehalococcoidia bacterium]